MVEGNLQADNEEHLFEHLFSQMPNGICIVNQTTKRISYINPEFENLSQYKAKAVINQLFCSILHGSDKDEQSFISYIENHLLEHKKWTGELQCLKADGTSFWAKSDISVYNHTQHGKYILCSFTDIDNHIKQNQNLKETLGTINSSIESPKDMVFLTIDDSYRYLFFNTNHANIIKSRYGITVSVDMNLLDCISNDRDRHIAKGYFDKALRGTSHTQVDKITVGDSQLYYEVHYNPLFNSNNEIIGATSFAKEVTARKQFEIALKESEERFKMLSDLSSEGIIIHNGPIAIDVNSTVEKILGYNKDELIGINLIDFLALENYRQKIYDSLIQTTFEPYEVLAKHKNGTILNIEIKGRRELYYNDKKVFVSTIVDITENKKNELEIKTSEADLKSQIENTTESIWSVDNNYKITIANSNFSRQFKMAFHHQLKRGDIVLNYLPDELQVVWKKRYDRALNGERFKVVDQYHFENLPNYVETAFNPVIVDDNIIGATCFTTDITKQKITEDALKLSEQKFKHLSDFSPACISIQRTDQYLYTNRAWELVSGYTKEEALSLTPLDIIHPDSVDEIKQRSEARLRGEAVPNRYDLKIITKSKQTKWLDISFTLINYENQTASLSVCFDITELKKAKEALQVSEHKLQIANSTKNKFFSIIAHDLRSPFSSILGLSKLLQSQYDELEDKERLNFVEEIMTNTSRTYSLLENLLNWARSQQGGIVINKCNLNLNQLIAGAIEPYLSSASQKSIRVKNEVSNDLTIFGDEYTLQTVVSNLFNNAIKYSFINGNINISAHSNGQHIIVSLSDTGIGMSDKIKASLFTINTSQSSPGTNNEPGTGLGLSICKEFVELNGGVISVVSTEGQGSTFSFNVPLQCIE